MHRSNPPPRAPSPSCDNVNPLLTPPPPRRSHGGPSTPRHHPASNNTHRLSFISDLDLDSTSESGHSSTFMHSSPATSASSLGSPSWHGSLQIHRQRSIAASRSSQDLRARAKHEAEIHNKYVASSAPASAPAHLPTTRLRLSHLPPPGPPPTTAPPPVPPIPSSAFSPTDKKPVLRVRVPSPEKENVRASTDRLEPSSACCSTNNKAKRSSRRLSSAAKHMMSGLRSPIIRAQKDSS